MNDIAPGAPAHAIVNRLVPVVAVLVLAVVTAGSGGRDGRSALQRASRDVAAPNGQVAEPAAAWSDVERLINERKLAAALEDVDAIRRSAAAGGGEADWTRALVVETQLLTALHGYETAARFLPETPWPPGPGPHVVLDLVSARALTSYLRAYSREIRQREQVGNRGTVDLKLWTADQIVEQALRDLADAWGLRDALGESPITSWSAYLTPNGYPRDVRGTIRDALTYQVVGLLADTSTWQPGQENELYRLDLASLLDGAAGTFRGISLDDTTAHPLRKLAAVLADLEGWHAAAGRRAAALETRLEGTRRLYAAFGQAADRRAIVASLEQRLPTFRDVPWWAEGEAQLAEFHREEDAPDSLVRARATAAAGWRAYPESLGGQHCRSIVGAIEAPDYEIAAMRADAAGRRSLEVTHRNLSTLWFRAFADDPSGRLASGEGEDLQPDSDEVARLVSRERSVASWQASLPGTPDFQSHRTFVTPHLARAGAYLIVASARADFGGRDNRLVAVPLLISNLVLVAQRAGAGAVEARALAGDDGAPVAGVAVSLHRFDWSTHQREVVEQTTDSRGLAAFRLPAAWQTSGLAFVARHGPDLAIDTTYLPATPPAESGGKTASLIYTDRSIYRPAQKLLWKVLVYQSSAADTRFHALAATPVTVSLVDPNNQMVESRLVSTNSFGSAAGEFTIPSGRPLGTWRVSSSLSGDSTVRVEEYKRPTFEVTLEDPPGPFRLNRPATVSGAARYYFGLPVTGGAVNWRVTREPVYPPWWRWWGWRPPSTGAEVVAAGRASLKEDGRFAVSFTPQADERLASGERGVTYRYRLAADVIDEGGETRSAMRVYRVGFVSLEPTIESARRFFPAGVAVELTAVRESLDGAPRPGDGRWRLLELTQPRTALLPAEQPLARPGEGEQSSRYETPGDGLRPRWDGGVPGDAAMHDWPDGAERAHGDVRHDAAGRAGIGLGLLSPGAYRLRYETIDEFGAPCETSREFVVAAAHPRLALPLVLEAEAASVSVGGTARLLVTSGFPGQTLLLDVYRGGAIVERRTLVAGRDGAIIEIPIGADQRGGFGVRLSMVRDHQFLTASQSIFVPWDDRKLTVSFATFRDTLRPGARETWRVSVKGEEGPVEAGAAELLAYMVDKSLDIFAPYRPPDPLALYADRAGVGACQASVGENQGEWIEGSDFASPPSWRQPEGDRLQPLEEYGVGGPGRRGGVFGEQVAVSGVAQPWAVPRAAPRLAAEEGGGIALQAAAPPDSGALPQLRSDFAETAFWQPQLRTGPDGSAAIEFTVPDSVTAWNVWVHAVTSDLRAGSLYREARSVKELMVRPYLPRFLREGDRAEIRVVVDNASPAAVSGWVTLELLDPATNASLLPDFGLSAAAARRPFTAGKGRSSRVTFSIVAPRRVGEVAFKVVGTASDLSDGELRPLPVLPSRLDLVQSRFVTLRDDDRRVMRFDDLARNDDPTRVSEQIVVGVDGQLFYSVLAALPYLVNYPYQCTEQTLNRFVSTATVSSLLKDYPAVASVAADLAKRNTPREPWEVGDPNRAMLLEETPWLQTARGGNDAGLGTVDVLDPRVADAAREASLARLRKAQAANGAFPWWPGGPPSPYMTLYIMVGLARAAEFGVDVPKEMVQRGWQYLAGTCRDDFKQAMGKDCCWELLTFLNYAASCYSDPSWTGNALTAEDRREILDFSLKHWRQHSPYLKGMLALTLKRMGRPEDARMVWNSVMDSAQTNAEQGTFWAPQDRSWLWYEDTIESEAFALRVLLELDPHDARGEGLVQWLFLNKKLNAWKSTRATAEVIYSLVPYLQQQGALGVIERLTVSTGTRRATFDLAPAVFSGHATRMVIAGPDIDPAADSAVTVEKNGKGLAFASATWRFSTDGFPAAGEGDFFSVARRYFKRVQSPQGAALEPLADGVALRVGDEVEVHITISAKHAAEYVHVRDPRAAGLEPVDALSSFHWNLGIGWYQEVRDSAANLFFERLPAGEQEITLRQRAATAGRFRVAPATIQSMYAPEFSAYSSGAELEVAGGE